MNKADDLERLMAAAQRLDAPTLSKLINIAETMASRFLEAPREITHLEYQEGMLQQGAGSRQLALLWSNLTGTYSTDPRRFHPVPLEQLIEASKREPPARTSPDTWEQFKAWLAEVVE